MSKHISAKPTEIAPTILLPGDPRRAEFVAETLLEGAVCFNQVRGMLGFTGHYRGKPVSVMGTGMGIPSLSIYIHELLAEYNVTTLVRIGTCGALQPDLSIGDIVLAMAASTDSHVNKIRFSGRDYAPTASFRLLLRAYEAAQARDQPVQVGPIFTSDTFYDDEADAWKPWAKFGALAVEMETAGLYTLAAKFRVDSLSILTVSDSLITGEAASAEERERGFSRMAEIALDAIS